MRSPRLKVISFLDHEECLPQVMFILATLMINLYGTKVLIGITPVCFFL